MSQDEIIEALLALGHTSGWVVAQGEITLWENSAKQPTEAELKAALGGKK